MPLQKRLLRRVQVGAVKRRSACHAAHRKNLQLDSFSCQVGTGFVPVNLRFHAPGVALRNAGFMDRQPQRDLSTMHVLADRAFADLAVRQLVLNPLLDAMGRVPLLARRLAVGLQHRIHKIHRRP